MTNQVIPAQAVEAALAAHLTFKNQRGMDNAENLMRHLLEAAAPHMLAGEQVNLGALEELLRDMEQQPPSELGPIRGMAGIIRAALGATK